MAPRVAWGSAKTYGSLASLPQRKTNERKPHSKTCTEPRQYNHVVVSGLLQNRHHVPFSPLKIFGDEEPNMLTTNGLTCHKLGCKVGCQPRSGLA